MKDLGDIHYFPGIEMTCTLEGILISQQQYVLSMLFKFGMSDCKSVLTPLEKNVKLCHDSSKACDPKRFQQILKSLIYFPITRLDLSYPVGMIRQFMARPTMEHL